MATTASPQTTPTASPIGRDTPRVDGPKKVTGTAQYTSDFHFPGTLYAVPVEATIANGRIVGIDMTAAERMPGVQRIFHRENIGKIFRSVPESGFQGICEERRPPFEDDVIRYYGQYVALAVAETFETAKAAADAVHVTCAKEKPNVATDLQADDDPEVVVTPFGRRIACRASAAMPTPHSPQRPSSSTRPMSRRQRRTIPSSCMRRPRSGKDRR